MKRQLLVLGGYGGVGKAMCRVLLQHTPHAVCVGGRNIQKANAFAAQLNQEFSGREVTARAIDASDPKSMETGFVGVDLVIVTASIPDAIEKVARAAVSARVDTLDILVRGDVVDRLRKFEHEIRKHKLIFITQAGFHPGLVAPCIRFGQSQFDSYEEARVYMAMDPVFEQPSSVQEIFYELIEGNSQVLDDGVWRKADHKDAVDVQFSEAFGQKTCYPLQMQELYGLEQELGLRSAGVYAAGFSRFIDHFIFPLSIIIGKISKSWSQRFSSWLLYQNIKERFDKSPRVEFRLEANGIQGGLKQQYRFGFEYEDAFRLTALAVLACLNQYFDRSIPRPGLYLMGQIVDEQRLITDLERMGVPMLEPVS